jgi:hypothetical protein
MAYKKRETKKRRKTSKKYNKKNTKSSRKKKIGGELTPDEQKMINDLKAKNAKLDSKLKEIEREENPQKEPLKPNTVTVKVFPNNIPGQSTMTLGDYRVVVDKNIPNDPAIVDHFLHNTMKYIKSHTRKPTENPTAEDILNEKQEKQGIFPNTKFKYVFNANEPSPESKI